MANEQWMKNLDDYLLDLPIINLAIPGTHDSLSYSVTLKSSISPDAPLFAKVLNWMNCGRFIKKIVYNWCVTQSVDILEQFKLGSRYFDLRVAVKDSQLYSCHALYGMPIFEALHDLNDILDTHPDEMVVLDFQHFYSFRQRHHAKLLESLNLIFDQKLVWKRDDVTSVTLRWMRRHKYQVIAIYRDATVKHHPFAWPSNKWPTLWPDTTDFAKLCSFLTETLKKRSLNAGFVSQCLFTPHSLFILRHISSTLKEKCSGVVNGKICQTWISKQSAGKPEGVNVIIADFIHMDNFGFCDVVVALNTIK